MCACMHVCEIDVEVFADFGTTQYVIRGEEDYVTNAKERLHKRLHFSTDFINIQHFRRERRIFATADIECLGSQIKVCIKSLSMVEMRRTTACVLQLVLHIHFLNLSIFNKIKQII